MRQAKGLIPEFSEQKGTDSRQDYQEANVRIHSLPKSLADAESEKE